MIRPYSSVMGMLHRFRRSDLVIACGLLLWGLPDVPWWWEPPGHAGATGPVLGALALTLAMSVPFCWRRQAPVTVLALAAGVLAVRATLHHDLISSFAAVLVAAYGLGSYGRAGRRYARWLGWAALAGALFVVATSGGTTRMAGAPLALLGAAFVLGDAASARRAESAAAVEAAHQAERTRIARELHDVVAHQLSAIAVQAGAARLTAAGAADPVLGPVIGTVEQLSREALAELNHLLGALRREADASPLRAATPTLAELDGLLAASRAAGHPVQLAVTGPPRPLPAGVSLSGYRIIQEALANVARHAHATRCAVRIHLDHGVHVDVRDNGAGLPAHWRAGVGIASMRERVSELGGELVIEPSRPHGTRVAARLPVREQP